MLTPAQAAAISGKTRQWLSRKAKSGKLRSFRNGPNGHYRYYRNDIEQLSGLQTAPGNITAVADSGTSDVLAGNHCPAPSPRERQGQAINGRNQQCH